MRAQNLLIVGSLVLLLKAGDRNFVFLVQHFIEADQLATVCLELRTVQPALLYLYLKLGEISILVSLDLSQLDTCFLRFVHHPEQLGFFLLAYSELLLNVHKGSLLDQYLLLHLLYFSY